MSYMRTLHFLPQLICACVSIHVTFVNFFLAHLEFFQTKSFPCTNKAASHPAFSICTCRY